MNNSAENLPAKAIAPWPSRGTPAVVAGTWDSARRWRDAATSMERAKLFCQVMLGFELRALRCSLAKSHGGDRKTAHARDEAASAATTWGDALIRELGISERTAFNLMAMADAAAPRLRKLPLLRDFDPAALPPTALPADTKAALEKAVHKLTDGLTQVEFMRELGLVKLPQGSGATGRSKGCGVRPRMTPTEEMDILRQIAEEDWRAIESRLLESYRSKFKALPDPQVEGQLAALEQAVKARKEWLRTPTEKRDNRLD